MPCVVFINSSFVLPSLIGSPAHTEALAHTHRNRITLPYVFGVCHLCFFFFIFCNVSPISCFPPKSAELSGMENICIFRFLVSSSYFPFCPVVRHTFVFFFRMFFFFFLCSPLEFYFTFYTELKRISNEFQIKNRIHNPGMDLLFGVLLFA